MVILPSWQGQLAVAVVLANQSLSNESRAQISECLLDKEETMVTNGVTRSVNADEMNKIDALLGAALLNGDLRQRLIEDRDVSVLGEFHLGAETQALLHNIDAHSLTELACAIVSTEQAQ